MSLQLLRLFRTMIQHCLLWGFRNVLWIAKLQLIFPPSWWWVDNVWMKNVWLKVPLGEGAARCKLTAILSVCSETRSWLVHLSSSGPLPRWHAQPMPGTSADGNVSPARRSAPGWRMCEAFSSWGASGSDMGGQYDGSQRKVRGLLEKNNYLMILRHLMWWIVALNIMQVILEKSQC